jgi:hypothetical protein
MVGRDQHRARQLFVDLFRVTPAHYADMPKLALIGTVIWLSLTVCSCGDKCVGNLSSVGADCPRSFDGTEADLTCGVPALEVSVWDCQGLRVVVLNQGFSGSVCYYDKTSHALVGAERGSDVPVFCNGASYDQIAGRIDPMCRENAPAIVKSCQPDGGAN